MSLYESKINSSTDPENPFFSLQRGGPAEKRTLTGTRRGLSTCAGSLFLIEM